MKYTYPILCLAGIASAHSAVNSIVFDGTEYPARWGPVDRVLNSRRVEWNSAGSTLFGYQPLTNVMDPGMTCHSLPTSPQLKAEARAGSNITVNWSPIVRNHLGPVASYLGRLETPKQTPQQVKFFKIAEKNYDPATKLWGNEQLILNNNSETIQIPSNIKPGTYIFRTELLALHANSIAFKLQGQGGPQFYPHCFNVEITGNGTDEPEGVYIPGAIKADLTTQFDVWGNTSAAGDYAPPGPPVYKGKYVVPTGAAPVVRDVGYYPPGLQRQYESIRTRADVFGADLVDFINNLEAVSNFGNSRKTFPTLLETLEQASKLALKFAMAPKLFYDIKTFNDKVDDVMN